MRASISESDRALIRAAEAAGRVRRIPRGMSGLPMPVWNGKDLVYQDGHDPMRAGVKSHFMTARSGYVDPAVTERRKRVTEMHRQGKHVVEIAEALSFSPNVIRMDHLRLGILPNPAPISGASAAQRAEIAKRRRSVAIMRASAMSAVQIADALKVSIGVIESDFRVLRRQEVAA